LGQRFDEESKRVVLDISNYSTSRSISSP
jgi:hypothetical protein